MKTSKLGVGAMEDMINVLKRRVAELEDENGTLRAEIDLQLRINKEDDRWEKIWSRLDHIAALIGLESVVRTTEKVHDIHIYCLDHICVDGCDHTQCEWLREILKIIADR